MTCRDCSGWGHIPLPADPEDGGTYDAECHRCGGTGGTEALTCARCLTAYSDGDRHECPEAAA